MTVPKKDFHYSWFTLTLVGYNQIMLSRSCATYTLKSFKGLGVSLKKYTKTLLVLCVANASLTHPRYKRGRVGFLYMLAIANDKLRTYMASCGGRKN